MDLNTDTAVETKPKPIFRRDYRPPDYWIDAVSLRFEIEEDHTLVTSTLAIRRNEESGPGPKPLLLDGERLALQSISLNNQPLAADTYWIDDAGLHLPSVPETFTLRTVVRIEPQNNTELSGLYRSGDTLCTQCEAEGFRRITFFLDRPDVMARFSTEIIANKHRFPVLLANGNRLEHESLDGDRHRVVWQDPFPKPSYLFALVAADLKCHADTFTTRSGRDIRLELWVEATNIDACEHAMHSLQKAMKWDEDVYGLEYDLDIYMVVAVSHFNMAAMENKGLNIFNAKYILARPQTATDDDYEDIEGVIAHEYFHNWTGNRVTCRDWFQLTLKEGLTVFRDEQFTADVTSAPVKRVQDVQMLRTTQFAEDQSPTSHPIRPDSYLEMNNFYTVTVYNKGAEVVRMLHTLFGPAGFRRGMDLYFERHDGQAVTCDDFLAAMADANSVDLSQFALWYAQRGTPRLEVEGTYDASAQTYTLELTQKAPVNVEDKKYRPMHMPIAIGLLDADGNDLALEPLETSRTSVRETTAVVELRRARQTVTFKGIAAPPTLSVLRGFSAPVKVRLERTIEELAFLMSHDSDPFARWDAAQSLAQSLILDLSRQADPTELDPRFIAAFGAMLADDELDGSLKALILRLPSERLLGQQQQVVDVDGLHRGRSFAATALAHAHADAFWQMYQTLASTAALPTQDRAQVDARRLRNLCLSYLVRLGTDDAIHAALHQLNTATTMTDGEAALGILASLDHPKRDDALKTFYERWKHDPLVLDKWFAAQAVSTRTDALERVIELCDHPDFTLRTPNRVRSLLTMFAARNQVRFHDASGRGYQLIADKVLEIDALNPQLAARLVGTLSQWRRFDSQRGAHMRNELTRIVEAPRLSRDVYELAHKSIA